MFANHDMALVTRVGHQFAVMCLVRTVKSGPKSSVSESPQYAYTKDLMKVVSIVVSRRRKKETNLDFKPIPTLIHSLGYTQETSQY